MPDFFEDLTFTVLFLNAVTGGTLLPAVALVLIVLVASGLWWMATRNRPAVEEMADPDHNPELDGWEAEWRRQQGGDGRG